MPTSPWAQDLDKEQQYVGVCRSAGATCPVLAVSAPYETAPIGNADDPTFLNAAVVLETPLSAADLKALVLRPLEDRLGRQRSADPNAPRPIDVDISLFNDAMLDLGKRHIPDPEILALSAHRRALGRYRSRLSSPGDWRYPGGNRPARDAQRATNR